MRWVGLGSFWKEHQLTWLMVLAKVVLVRGLLFATIVTVVAKCSPPMVTTNMNVSSGVSNATRMGLLNVPFAARNWSKTKVMCIFSFLLSSDFWLACNFWLKTY